MLPTDEVTSFGTLERCFRDLVWASYDAFLAGDQASCRALIDARKSVSERMSRAHPDRHRAFMARLERHMHALGSGVSPERTVMRPQVVNENHYLTDGNIDFSRVPRPYIYIGRGTALANTHSDVDTSLHLYKKHLWARMKARDETVMRVFAAIRWGTNLVGTGDPDPCHGHVVVLAWMWLQRQPWWSPDEFRS